MRQTWKQVDCCCCYCCSCCRCYCCCYCVIVNNVALFFSAVHRAACECVCLLVKFFAFWLHASNPIINTHDDGDVVAADADDDGAADAANGLTWGQQNTVAYDDNNNDDATKAYLMDNMQNEIDDEVNQKKNLKLQRSLVTVYVCKGMFNHIKTVVCVYNDTAAWHYVLHMDFHSWCYFPYNFFFLCFSKHFSFLSSSTLDRKILTKKKKENPTKYKRKKQRQWKTPNASNIPDCDGIRLLDVFWVQHCFFILSGKTKKKEESKHKK